MPKFALASLHIVCFFCIITWLFSFVTHQAGKKIERKPEPERNPRACSQPRAQSRSPSRSQQLIAFPAPHTFPYYSLFPTDVPGVPERSQRSQFTARMHSNEGRARIKISTVQCNHHAPAATKINREESASITAPSSSSLNCLAAPLRSIAASKYFDCSYGVSQTKRKAWTRAAPIAVCKNLRRSSAPGLKSTNTQLSRNVKSRRNQNEKENRSIESLRSVC